jgi:hypothetical protein
MLELLRKLHAAVLQSLLLGGVTPQLRLEGNSSLKLPGLAEVLSGNFPSSKAAEKFILRTE